MRLAGLSGMRLRAIALFACLAVVPVAIACSGGGSETGPTSNPPTTLNTVISPASGLSVTLALSSVHLGAQGCTHDESQDLKPASCAAPLDASAPHGTGL